MNVYTCTSFKGHHPVGTSAVVIANDPNHAATILNKRLQLDHALPGDAEPEDMKLLDTTLSGVVVLNDGDY